MNAMPYFTIKILLWIFTFKLILSQDKHGAPTFMTKVENCSRAMLNNNGTEDIESKEDLKITYLLFTRENPQNEYILQPNSKSVENSTFNPCVGTIFLVPGFVQSIPKSSAIFDVKDEFLKQGEFNVVIVDYTKYNDYTEVVRITTLILYIKSVFSYVPTIGSNIASVIKILMSVYGIKPESVYLIGHSLAAHIAGSAGKQIQNLGRITGIDAAGPVFRFLPESLKLSVNDAIFVDAIHTNGAVLILKGFGIYKSYADQDYFPNGGSLQPGCVYGSAYNDTFNVQHPIDSLGTLISCNHDRALQLYRDSINNCEFLSVLCGNYDDFREGDCPRETSVTSRMGFYAEKINSLSEYSEFYLQTGENPPFCLYKNNSL